MKPFLLAAKARINGWPLQLRGLLFAALLAGFALLGYSVWIAPEQQSNQHLAVRLALQTAQLKTAQAELAAALKASAANQAVAELALNSQRLNSLNQQLAQVLPAGVSLAALPAVAAAASPLVRSLTELLRQREGLTLLRLSALAPTAGAPPQPASSSSATSATSASAAAALTVSPGGLKRQGLELSVSGSYAELTLYLQALETALPDLRWGSLLLKSSGQQSELNLQLFVLGAAQ